jgi:uncharacterized membrane protein YphA (DoxX/SURF4 family)
MKQSNGTTVFAWIIRIVLALLFIGASLGKVTSNPHWIERFRAYGYPDGFCLLIGVLEAAGAIGLLIPRTAGYAAMGLFGIMLGAGVTQATHHEAAQLWRPIVFAVLLAIVIYLRKPWPQKQQMETEVKRATGQPQ